MLPRFVAWHNATKKASGSNNITISSNKIPFLQLFPLPPCDFNILNNIRDGMKKVQGTGYAPMLRTKMIQADVNFWLGLTQTLSVQNKNDPRINEIPLWVWKDIKYV